MAEPVIQAPGFNWQKSPNRSPQLPTQSQSFKIGELYVCFCQKLPFSFRGRASPPRMTVSE